MVDAFASGGASLKYSLSCHLSEGCLALRERVGDRSVCHSCLIFSFAPLF